MKFESDETPKQDSGKMVFSLGKGVHLEYHSTKKNDKMTPDKMIEIANKALVSAKHHNDSISEICRETKNNIQLLSHLKCAFHACIHNGATMEVKKLVFSAYQKECKRLEDFDIEE